MSCESLHYFLKSFFTVSSCRHFKVGLMSISAYTPMHHMNKLVCYNIKITVIVVLLQLIIILVPPALLVSKLPCWNTSMNFLPGEVPFLASPHFMYYRHITNVTLNLMLLIDNLCSCCDIIRYPEGVDNCVFLVQKVAYSHPKLPPQSLLATSRPHSKLRKHLELKKRLCQQ